jgi:hypothetical protein
MKSAQANAVRSQENEKLNGMVKSPRSEGEGNPDSE